MSVANVLLKHGRRPVWHLVDARDQIVGRLAVQIAPLLSGKHKPTYSPNVVCGDYVVVINAADVHFTGRKWKEKVYRWHTGYPGGLRERSVKDQLQRKPEIILRRAIMGMLPKNSLRRDMIQLLKIYEGPNHPHAEDLQGKTCILKERDG